MTRFRPSALPLAVVPAVVYASWVRPRMRSWGATQAETPCSFPGDELVPDPNGGRRWPRPCQHHRRRSGPGWCRWVAAGGLVQLGLGGQRRSTQRGAHRARMARPGTGTTLYRVPKGPTNWWTVAFVEPNRTLVLQTSYGFFGRSFDPRTGAVPWASTEGTWAFYLNEAPDGQPVWWSAQGAAAARRCSLCLSRCWWENPCISSCSLVSSTTCALGWSTPVSRSPRCEHSTRKPDRRRARNFRTGEGGRKASTVVTRGRG